MKHILTLATLVFATSCFAQVPDHVPIDGLVAWYPFNGNANDESGNGNDGIVNGPVSTADHLGADNSALLFDGADDYIEISNTNGISSSQGLTMSIWFHWEGTNGNDVQQYLFLIANNPNGAITISDDGSCGMNVLNCNCADDINLTSQIVANTWYQATMTYSLNDGLLKMYLNGELVDSSVESMYSYYTTNNPADRFGNYHFNSHYFKGKLNDAGLWNRALTEQEVFALYNAESPTTGCTDELACNYSPEANVNDDSCTYPPFGLTDCEAGGALCGEGTAWDEVSQSCVVANVSDTDFDGCVGINDFLIHLSNFGSGCGPESAWACGDPLEHQGYDYETVQIGGQCWFAENLRSDVYQNGDAINSGLSTASWQTTAFGATAVYGQGASQCTDNDPGDQACDENWAILEYGRLYNFLAVDDERGLCPQGWHVPTDEEFQQMEGALGMSAEELSAEGYRGTNQGDMLKTQFGWFSNGNGTNEVGFNGEASGFRGQSASFLGAGVECNWWTADAAGVFDGDEDAWSRTLRYNQGGIQRYHWSQRNGFSVRCIQDSE